MKRKILTIGIAALMLTESTFVYAEEAPETVNPEQSIKSMFADNLLEHVENTNGILSGTGIDVLEEPSLEPEDSYFLPGMEAENALSGSILPIVDDKQAEMARCWLPQGWQMSHQEVWCTLDTGVFTPGRLFLKEENQEGDIVMGYYSPCSYDEYVQMVVNGMDVTPQIDEGYDYDNMTPAKRFLEADGYCDYMAQAMTDQMTGRSPLTVVSETKPDAHAYEQLQQKRIQNHQESAETFDIVEDMINGAAGGTSITEIDVSASYCGQHEKEYSFVVSGEEYRLIVNAQVSGIQVTTRNTTPLIYGGGALTASQVMNYWRADSVHYSVMPASKAPEQRRVFEQFVLNTRVSDEYMALLDFISGKLLQAIAQGRNQGISVYYSDLESDIHAGLEESSYDDDRFSDYILDQNEYVTSSGDEIKVSTAYDYVYEDGSGNVVVSNTILDGMERLYPR